MGRQIRFLLWLAASLVLIFVLIACGGSGETGLSSSSTSTSTETSTENTTPESSPLVTDPLVIQIPEPEATEGDPVASVSLAAEALEDDPLASSPMDPRRFFPPGK